MPHCRECGAKLVEDMMFCGDCGAEVSETSGTSKQRFCKDCGLQISPSRFEEYQGRCGPCTQKARGPEIIGYSFIVISVFVIASGLFFTFFPVFRVSMLEVVSFVMGGVLLLIAIFLIIRGRRKRS